MDSIQWSKRFDIVSISRLELNSAGIHYDLVVQLTDDDMFAIADLLKETFVNPTTNRLIEFVTRLYIAEKGTDNRTGEANDQTD